MKRSPIDTIKLRKLITLSPKSKDVCTVCRTKMRPPSPDEERTPTCDSCAQDLLLDVMPKLIWELETLQVKLAKARKTRIPKTARTVQVTQVEPVPLPSAEPSVLVSASAGAETEAQNLVEEVEAEEEEDEAEAEEDEAGEDEDEAEESEEDEEDEEPEEDEPEDEEEPDVEKKEFDERTDCSNLALALAEVEPPPVVKRRRVQTVAASPQQIQAAVIQLRGKFER